MAIATLSSVGNPPAMAQGSWPHSQLVHPQLAQSSPADFPPQETLACPEYTYLIYSLPMAKLETVVQSCRQALQENPKNPIVYPVLGAALERQRKPEEVLPVYQAWLQLAPEDPDVYLRLAGALTVLARYDEAIQTYQTLLSRQSIEFQAAGIDAYRGWGEILAQQSKTQERIDLYRQATRRYPQDFWLQIELGDVLQAQAFYSEAIAAYRQAIQIDRHSTPPIVDIAYARWAETLTLQGKTEEILPMYQQAIQAFPDLVVLRLGQGDALATLGRDQEAIASYQTAAQMIQAQEQEPLLLGLKLNQIYQKWADVLRKDQNYVDVIRLYQTATQVVPTSAALQIELGNAHWAIGDRPMAEKAYRQAIQLEPESSYAWSSLALWLREQERIPEAVTTYRDGIQRLTAAGPERIFLNEGLSVLYAELGDTLSESQDHRGAADAYQNALEWSNTDRALYRLLALALAKDGQLQASIGHFETAIALSNDPLYPNPTALPSLQANLKEVQRSWAIAQNPELALAPETIPSKGKQPQIKNLRAVVRVLAGDFPEYAGATGWVYRRQGDTAWIVTNRHVITQADEVTPEATLWVELYSEPKPGQYRRRLSAELLNQTAPDAIDLAVLKVQGLPQDIQPLPFAEADPQPGDPVLMIGQPFTGPGWTVKPGEVLEMLNRETEAEMVAFAAVISSGNSGGPILNAQNQVLGIVSLAADIHKESEQGFTGTAGRAYSRNAILTQLKHWGLD
jgi:tetratricopeptide (TPR) repeat protein